mmetsp:Transcript_3455/g.12460  ORF Transcript_3455/g.12460 Transcript_3455/m.12460 type:complete len:221 (+) Transcript_3455:69-731(+)
MARSVYLLVPNLIGYARVLLNVAAFTFAASFDNRTVFSSMYFTSFALDCIDGYAARLLKQTSTFGTVLDMVTDRVATVCLLMLLGASHSPYLPVCLALASLDLFSHWFQMYASLVRKKASHKAIGKDESSLLKLYYNNRPFMGTLCLSAELLYLCLYLSLDRQYSAFKLRFVSTSVPLVSVLVYATFPGCALKQVINIIQLKSAADALVALESPKWPYKR